MIWSHAHVDQSLQKVNLELLVGRSGVQIFVAFSVSFRNTRALKSPFFASAFSGVQSTAAPFSGPSVTEQWSFPPWEFFQARKLAKLRQQLSQQPQRGGEQLAHSFKAAACWSSARLLLSQQVQPPRFFSALSRGTRATILVGADLHKFLKQKTFDLKANKNQASVLRRKTLMRRDSTIFFLIL